MNIRNRRGEGSASVVGIVAILVLVLIAGYFLFFRGEATAPVEDNTDTINVTIPTPDAMDGGDTAPAPEAQ